MAKRVSAAVVAIDPIEKKPLYHFHPGTTCLSIACTGCNFRCLNCQNHEISQVSPQDVNYYELQPSEVVALCQKHHCPSIAYTYTEPLTYIEYITDTARKAHEAGLWNILVSAGYVCQEPLSHLLPYLDAANVDLKSFSESIYQRVSGGHLQPVLDTILAMRDAGVWLEITNLVIPGINDDMQMIKEMCKWLKDNGLSKAPLHFSRFFPRYKMQDTPPTPRQTLYAAKDTPPTPRQTLYAAKQIAEEEGIKHVYLGNI